MRLSSERSELRSAGALWASLALGLGFCLTATGVGAAGAPSAARVREFGSALLFEPNQGQTEAGVEYLARGEGYRLYLRGSEAVLALAAEGQGPRASVRLRLVGAASQPEAVGRDRRPSVSHYLIGADPSLWRRNVPHYGQVEYREVYPGVSLVYYGREGALEYDFVLAPGANPEAIRFEVEGASVRLDDGGNLVLTTPAGDLLQQAPVLYQDSPEGRAPVQGRFVLHGSNRVGFRVSHYDRSKALVIDPVLKWSRFHGGRAADHADGVAVDQVDGSIYVTGQTNSDNFPTTPGVFQRLPPGGQDAFVTKFRPDGAIIWSTYLGGNRGDEFGTAIAVDGAGQAYVTGWTESDDFPTKNPLPGAFRPPRDAFVSKLDRDGANLIYSTFLGGQGSDEGNGIAVDPTQPDGEAVVVGVTSSDSSFPLVNALIPTRDGPSDAFISRFKKAGDSLIFSTFWGGRGDDKAFAVALLGNEPVVVGGTNSNNFPLLNPQQGYKGLTDAFVSMLKPDGLGVVFSTYLGGGSNEAAFAVATDPTGFFIGGQTFSGDFPVQNAFQPVLQGPSDGFITKLRRTDFKIEYSTFLGGKLAETVAGLGVDSRGYVYAAGSTTSTDFPLVDPLPVGTSYRGNSDVFVAKLAPTGCTLTYSTYLGSDGIDFGNALALERDGTAYVVGQAGSGFPVTGGPPFQGASDGFVLRIDDSPEADIKISVTDTPDPVLQGGLLTYAIDVTNLGPSGAFDVVFKDTLDAQVLFLGATPASCVETAGIVTCPLGCIPPGQTASITIDVLVLGGPLLTNKAEATTGENDPGSPNTVIETTTVSLLTADLEVTKAGPPTIPVGGTFTYQLTVKNNGPDATTLITVQDLLPMGTVFQSASLGCVLLPGDLVNCDVASLLPGFSAVFTITVRATIAGIIVNRAAVSGPDFDPVAFNNMDEITTTVTGGPTGPLQFFTATATDNQNFLEWKNPAAGPYNSTKILYRSMEFASDCAAVGFPTGPDDGGSVPLLNDGLAGIGGHGTFAQPALNDSLYCFAAFVQKDAAGTLFSGPRYVTSKPFDTSGPVKWAYSTGGASMAPPSYGSAGMFAASGGDQVLHSMVRGDGATGGHWPPSWTPLELGGPAQSRHPVIMAPSLIPSSPELVLLGVQDGTARAVDAVTGQQKWQQPLGPAVQAALGGMFKDFGGAWDYGLVGTWDSVGNNKFFALNPKTGAPINSFTNGGGANGIGIISGGAQVDYAGQRVYFASRVKNPGPGSPGTLWCLTLTPAGLGGLCPGAWPVNLGDIDGSPILRNGVIYVGNNLGFVHAVNTDGTLKWPVPFNTGDGAVKGFLFPDRNSSALFFATLTTIWGITDAGPNANVDWSTQLPGAGPPKPSIVVWNPGSTLIHVGGSDGKLYQIDFSTVPLPPTAITSVTLGDGLAAGAPTLDRLTGFVYVGSDAGIIYAVQTPLP